MKTTKSILVTLAMLLIAGCASQAPVGTVSAVTSTPELASTLTPTMKPSEIPTATSILLPTETPISTIQNFEGRLAIAGLSRQHSQARLFNLRNGEIQDIPESGPWSISWSPDYQRVAFIGGGTVDSHPTAIYVSKPDGSELKKYADSKLWKADLSWSPDGKSIVFTFDNRDGKSSGLAILNLSSGETYLLANDQGDERAAVWSPDGKQIAYAYQNGELPNESWIMNSDGSNPKRLSDFPIANTGIDWSPDGNWLAVISDENNDFHDCGDVYIIRPDGSDLTRLTNLSGCATDVTWSPDGKYLALVIRDEPNEMQCQLYVMDITGANLVTVGEEEELRIEDIDWGL